MRKHKNYYSPSAYDVHRNAYKARKNTIEDKGENTDNIDVLVMEIDKENKRHLKTDPPSAPLNAKKAPKAINIKKEHRSVYDEIAERREREKQAKVSNTTVNFRQSNENYLSKPDEAQSSEEFENDEIFSHSLSYEHNEIESGFDVKQEYEVKRKNCTKLWVILIILLSFLCIGLCGLYAYQQGLFDSLLKCIGF